MKSFQNLPLLLLAATSALAAPVVPPGVLLPRHETRILPRQQNIAQPVSFQTVETTQTQVGTITQTCRVTLTPITGGDGAQSVREDKDCTYVVLPSGQTPPPPPSNSGSVAPPSQTDGQTVSTDAGTTTTLGTTTTSSASSIPVSADSTTTAAPSASTTDTPSETPSSTLVTTTPLDDSNSSAPTAGATDSTSAPTAGATDSTSAPAAPSASDSLSTTSVPVTITSVLPDGSTTTLVTTTPSAVQAQGAQEEVPGRKLEVLPIGLGVFAGISVIALIIVGLVTYERTKYRRAFRQRKLAEAGANMGYGGMADRT